MNRAASGADHALLRVRAATVGLVSVLLVCVIMAYRFLGSYGDECTQAVQQWVRVQSVLVGATVGFHQWGVYLWRARLRDPRQRALRPVACLRVARHVGLPATAISTVAGGALLWGARGCAGEEAGLLRASAGVLVAMSAIGILQYACVVTMHEPVLAALEAHFLHGAPLDGTVVRLSALSARGSAALAGLAALPLLEPEEVQLEVEVGELFSLRALGAAAAADADCSICIAPIDAGARVYDVPCGHLFHRECLEQWVRVRPVCPNCQRSFV